MTTLLPDIKIARRLDPADLPPRGPVLCDLDGCLVSDGMAFPEARAFVRACANRLWIVSNNSTDCAANLALQFNNLGWSITSDRILLAGEQTIYHLFRSYPDATFAIYASDMLCKLATDLGMRIDHDMPDIVLVCRDIRFNLNALDRLTRQISGGAAVWASNLDTAHPSQTGQAVAETGVLLAALRAVVGEVDVQCLGKPAPYLANLVFAHDTMHPSEAVFIGDNPKTDGALARAAGISFIHIDRKRGWP